MAWRRIRTCHYLNQCTPDLLAHVCGTRGRWTNGWFNSPVLGWLHGWRRFVSVSRDNHVILTNGGKTDKKKTVKSVACIYMCNTYRVAINSRTCRLSISRNEVWLLNGISIWLMGIDLLSSLLLHISINLANFHSPRALTSHADSLPFSSLVLRWLQMWICAPN